MKKPLLLLLILGLVALAGCMNVEELIDSDLAQSAATADAA